MEALSDGHTVAPLIKVGYLHARRGAKTYLFHFGYQTKDSEYPQVSLYIYVSIIRYDVHLFGFVMFSMAVMVCFGWWWWCWRGVCVYKSHHFGLMCVRADKISKINLHIRHGVDVVRCQRLALLLFRMGGFIYGSIDA